MGLMRGKPPSWNTCSVAGLHMLCSSPCMAHHDTSEFLVRMFMFLCCYSAQSGLFSQDGWLYPHHSHLQSCRWASLSCHHTLLYAVCHSFL
jgi:hypothetical protein